MPEDTEEGTPPDGKRIWQKRANAPSLLGRIIAVKVGNEEEGRTYNIHEDPLTCHSKFFKAALKKPWKEATERVVKLSDDKIDTVELFIHFVYTGKIFSWREGEYVKTATGHDDDEWDTFTNAWVLGEKLISSSFKDAVTDAVLAKMTTAHVHPLESWRTTYQKTSATSGCRKLLVDIAAHMSVPEDFDSGLLGERIHEFWYDVARSLVSSIRNVDDEGLVEKPRFEMVSCHYYDHVAEGKPCYKTMFGN